MTGRFVDRELRKRRNRRKKIREIRARLQAAHSSEEKERLLTRLRKIIIDPRDIPELAAK